LHGTVELTRAPTFREKARVLPGCTFVIGADTARRLVDPRYYEGSQARMIAALAETNRPPFDLPEADTELVAGYHTEYSGMRFGLYSTAEYINMITLSGLAVTLFFGGWGGPYLPGPIWFLIKLGAFIFVFIWMRATLPRLRYDQLMRFGWKVLLPVATLNALVTAILVALL